MDGIRWLDSLEAADVAVAGGKGANLGELVGAGFAVPDGFVVTTAAYDEFVASSGLGDAIAEVVAVVIGPGSAGQAVNGLAGRFAGATVPGAVADSIREAYARLGGEVPVAVRSSATAEDLAEASFAGQQDTYLNVVGAEALVAAVRDCWASLWTERAIRYRASHGVDSHGLSLAVVVQRLVPADAAGVMFTANPANGRTEETVITAAWGLGESVVSGSVDTDTIVLRTDDGQILRRDVADKAIRVDAADTPGERTRTSPNPEHLRRKAVLEDAQARELAAIGSSVADHFGAPQDIEWLIADGAFSIVQSRPITALPERIGDVPNQWPVPEPRSLYFRASITEQLPNPLTPLFAGLMETAVPTGLKRLLNELSPGIDFGDVGFPTINGYAFYRYSYQALGRMTGMTGAMVRLVGGDGGGWAEARWRLRLGEYAAEVRAEETVAGAGLPARALLDAVGRLVDAMAYYYTSVQTIIPVASMAELTWVGVYRSLLKRDGAPAADVFILGFDSEPIRTEKSLYDLSRWVLEQSGLAEALRDPDRDCLADDAPAGVDGGTWAEWLHRFRAHLAAHGHTVYDLDFANAVPADDPTPVLQALRFDLTAEAPDPYVRQRQASAARENAGAGLLTRLGGWRAERTRSLLTWVQHTAPLREDALAAMGLYVPPARRLLGEFGARLVKAGALDEPLDVCWLSLPEARQAASGLDGEGELPTELRDRIARRREMARGQRLASPPQYLPKSAAMDKLSWMFPAREGQSGNVLSGNVGSGGVVTAKARVLDGPEDFAAFQPGEILVAAITTPAYTPLFAMAAGVVTDIGGVLSHGSIVAREYGIPAVLGTGSATRVIHTGDEITVDGGAGKVHRAGVAEAAPVSRPKRTTWLVAGGVALAVAALAVGLRRRPS